MKGNFGFSLFIPKSINLHIHVYLSDFWILTNSISNSYICSVEVRPFIPFYCGAYHPPVLTLGYKKMYICILVLVEL